MKYASQYDELDELDQAILAALQIDARLSNAELARRISLSQSAVYNRLRRLEELGFVRGYVTLLDRELAGFDLLCFVHIRLQVHQSDQIERFREAIKDLPQVLECHHVTGEYDYLLKVVARNRKDLEQLVINRLTPIPGVAHILTSLVFTEVKTTTALPLE